MKYFYFVSLGSNIRPTYHVPQMLEHLLAISPQLDISTIGKTTPAGMLSTEHYFLNLAVRIQTAHSPEALKKVFNAIEVKLGRDRSDPLSKKKDRPADLDILFQLQAGQQEVPLALMPPEPYVRPFVLELMDYLDMNSPILPTVPIDRVALPFHDRQLGKHPQTIAAPTTISRTSLLQAPLGN
ncbi:MAG: 2-amino-4-hydroxy-6-hydroxymethyldihydropteridine diphosphokinase [Bacteroidota bacterium]